MCAAKRAAISGGKGGQALTSPEAEGDESSEIVGNVACGPSLVTAGKSDKWTVQDSNTPAISAEKPHIPQTGAAKSAAENRDSDFAQAVAAIMALPLSDAEKAQAVRRLLAGQGGGR